MTEIDYNYPKIGDITIAMVPLVDFTKDLPLRITSKYENESRILPEELEQLKDKQVAEIIEKGGRVTNNTGLSLGELNYGKDRIELIYRPVKYFDFVATHLSLDLTLPSGETVRQKYGDLQEMLKTDGYNQSVYAKKVGSSTVVLTPDNKIILQQRSRKTAVVPGVMHVSIAEGMLPTDTDKRGEISPKITALRALHQELGFSQEMAEEKGIDESKIRIITLGLSYQFLQPEFVMLAELPITAEEILKAAEHGRGKWEREKLIIAPFTYETIEKLLQENNWSPHAFFALAMALKAKHQI